MNKYRCYDLVLRDFYTYENSSVREKSAESRDWALLQHTFLTLKFLTLWHKDGVRHFAK